MFSQVISKNLSSNLLSYWGLNNYKKKLHGIIDRYTQHMKHIYIYMNEWKFIHQAWKHPHKNMRVHSARCTHPYSTDISQLYKHTASRKGSRICENSYKLLLLPVNKNSNNNITGTSSQKVRRTGQNWMGVETRSQMTSHCNGNANHSKTALSLSCCLSYLG